MAGKQTGAKWCSRKCGEAAYYAANKGAIAERKRNWRAARIEVARANDRRYYAANRESRIERKRNWRAANPEAMREDNRKYRDANREALLAKKRQRYAAAKQNNPQVAS